jgi:tetratricopeptide (TPR) repeat protein
MALFNIDTHTKKAPKRALIIFLVGAVVVTLGVIGYYHFKPQHNTARTAQQAAAFKGDDLSVIIQKEQDFKANNQIDQGLAYYDTQIKLYAGRDDQSELMLGKSQLALDAHKFDVALAAAKEANQTKKSYRSLKLLGDVTKAQGNTAAALDYYKQALAAVPSNMPMIGPRNIKTQLNDMIKELSV